MRILNITIFCNDLALNTCIFYSTLRICLLIHPVTWQLCLLISDPSIVIIRFESGLESIRTWSERGIIVTSNQVTFGHSVVSLKIFFEKKKFNLVQIVTTHITWLYSCIIYNLTVILYTCIMIKKIYNLKNYPNYSKIHYFILIIFLTHLNIVKKQNSCWDFSWKLIYLEMRNTILVLFDFI